MVYHVDVPQIRPLGWEDELVKRCFAAWIVQEIAPTAQRLGKSAAQVLRNNFLYLKAARQSLDNPEGLSKDKNDRSQRALMAPQFCENFIAQEVGGHWPQNYPRLWEAFYKYFEAGHMGKYSGTGTRDFGAALGSGDKD